MSMPLHPIAFIPEETVRVARAAFPRGNIYLTMRDQLGALYQDENFAVLFPKRGRLAEAPWQLALVCVFQFVEGLSDRQAAEAVRSRIDWKYALSLDLTDPGFDYSLLSKFRARLLAGSAEMILLETMLERFKSSASNFLARIAASARSFCTQAAGSPSKFPESGFSQILKRTHLDCKTSLR
jgi:transposase